MVFKTTSTKKTSAAFTLIELMVTSAVGTFILAAFMIVFWFSNRSLASLANYMDLDQTTQIALDKMSREIRQINSLTSASSNSIAFLDNTGNSIRYNYDSGTGKLTRVQNATNVTTYLTSCDSLSFSIFQRTPDTSTFQPVSTTNVANTKVIELTWNCSRTIYGSKVNTESMQSAKIVIRKK